MSKYQRTKLSLKFLICILLLSTMGCTQTFNVKVNDSFELPKPLIEPLELNVGVYYSEEFRTHQTTREENIGYSTAICNVSLGTANQALFEYLFSHSFTKVTHVSSEQLATDSLKDIDLLIAPYLANYIYYPSNAIILEYAVEIYGPKNDNHITWNIKSTEFAEDAPVLLGAHDFIINETTKKAMRKIASKYFIGFREEICSLNNSSEYDQ